MKKRQIFFKCFKIGLLSFGGLTTVISLMEKEFSDDNLNFSFDEIIAGVATVSMIPGPTTVQVIIFLLEPIIGKFKAIVAGICFLIPSTLLVILFSSILIKFKFDDFVQKGIQGMNSGVIALLTITTIKLMKDNIKSILDVILFVLTIAALTIGANQMFILIVFSLLGAFLYRVKR